MAEKLTADEINKKDSRGRTLLYIACELGLEDGMTEVVNKLI